MLHFFRKVFLAVAAVGTLLLALSDFSLLSYQPTISFFLIVIGIVGAIFCIPLKEEDEQNGS